MSADRIALSGLTAVGHHGVFDHERRDGQEFSVDLVLHLSLTDGGRRVLTSVREVVDADGLSMASNEILRPGPDGRAVPGAPPSNDLLKKLAYAGFYQGLLDDARTAPGGGWT